MSVPEPDDEPVRRLEQAWRRLHESRPASPNEDAAWNAFRQLEEALEQSGAADEPSRPGDRARGR